MTTKITHAYLGGLTVKRGEDGHLRVIEPTETAPSVRSAQDGHLELRDGDLSVGSGERPDRPRRGQM